MNTDNSSPFNTEQGKGSFIFSLLTHFKDSQLHSRLNYYTTNCRSLPMVKEEKQSLVHIYQERCSVIILVVLAHTTHWCVKFFILRNREVFWYIRVSRSNHAARIGSYSKYCLVHLLSRTLSAKFLLFTCCKLREKEPYRSH